MNIKPPVMNSTAGIQRGLDGLERNAQQVASASTGSGEDVSRPLVESRLHKLQVEANVDVLRTQDEMIGSLLDEMA